MEILKIIDVSKHFGGLAAVEHVSFDVHQGEILGIIGPNGAGKSTLFNVISGIYKPTGGAGDILFKNENIAGMKPSQIAKKGLVRTFQDTRLFGELPMLENIALGRHLRRRPFFWSGLFNTRLYREDERGNYQKAMEILAFLGLDRPEGLASMQPLGHQRSLGSACVAPCSRYTMSPRYMNSRTLPRNSN